MDFPADFTGDGWPDVVTVSYGGAHGGIFLYVNPKGEERRWDKYKVVDDVQSEIAVMRDVDGDACRKGALSPRHHHERPATHRDSSRTRYGNR